MLLRRTNKEPKWSSTKSIFISEVRRDGKLVPLRRLLYLLIEAFPDFPFQRGSLSYIYIRQTLSSYCSAYSWHFVLLVKLLLSTANVPDHWLLCCPIAGAVRLDAGEFLTKIRVFFSAPSRKADPRGVHISLSRKT